jgi:hypothetical protein
MRPVALVSPIWHRYIARLSLAESGLSVARATPCYLTVCIFEKGFAVGGLCDWFGADAVSWILDLVIVGSCGVERSAPCRLMMIGSDKTRYVQRRTLIS